jgi:two-component system OmpR family response regulator
MKHILFVDDDPHLGDVVVYALEREGFRVTAARDGEEALLRVRGGGIDLIVLDVTMPELDGLEVCRRVRAQEATRALPIVFLSSRDEEIDKVIGLEIGGDDYVTKPFSPRELVARVKAVLRRADVRVEALAAAAREGERRIDRTIEVGPIRVSPDRHEVRCHDQPIRLTVTELGVLSMLLDRPGRVLTRTQLMEGAYAYDNLITERTIDTHVKRIRKKFREAGHDPIETVHGLGYKLRS